MAEADATLSTGSEAVFDSVCVPCSKDAPLSTGSEAVFDSVCVPCSKDASLSTGSEAVFDSVCVPCSKDASLSTGSDAVFDIVCEPCSKDGQRKEAVSYCRDCRGHICRDCVRDHRHIRSLKHHQLTDTVTKDVNKIKASYVNDLIVNSTRTTTSFFQSMFGTESTDNCFISGMTVVGDDKLVAADWNLYTIKLIDTTSNKIVDEHKLDKYTAPWDVTTCKDTVAATIPDASKIVFLKYTGGLVHDREISVDGDCQGIDCYDDKLFVIIKAYHKLEVITTAGTVLQTFTYAAPSVGKYLFESPIYVTVNAANQRIYVSEYRIGRVVVLDMAGNHTGTYEDDELGWPRQMAVNRAGMMFLGDYVHSTVHLLSLAGEKAKILLTRQDQVERPWSVCYCENTGRLYVGKQKCDTIKVYKLSFENL